MNRFVRHVFPLAALICVAGMISKTSDLADTRLVVAEGTGSLYRVSQPAGERALLELSKTSQAEDAWICQGDTWIDIGGREKESSVVIDLGALESALRIMKNIEPRDHRERLHVVFFHFHPSCGEPLEINPPSSFDVRSLALMKQKCREILGTELVGVLIDGRGKWTYDITREVERSIIGPEAASDGYALAHGYAQQTSAACTIRYSAAVQYAILRGADQTPVFIDIVRELGVSMTYDPL